MSETTRFAPSPTGLLHLGHAFAALTAYRAAMQAGPPGQFLLRMEDLDRGRSRTEFDAAIRDDLTWLGLTWEQPVLCQSARSDAYRAALTALEQRQLIYPCFCTRGGIAEEIARAVQAPHGAAPPGGDTIYPGTCRDLSPADRNFRMQQGARFAVRLDSTRAAALCGELTFTELGEGPHAEKGCIRVNPLLFGDIVLARKDLPAAYHLAVVLDDAYQQVSLVTRGNDLFTATHVQRLLQRLLNLPVPRYAHHRLILDAAGRKFSKRDRAVTLQSMRAAGVTAADIFSRLDLSAINTGVQVPPLA